RRARALPAQPFAPAERGRTRDLAADAHETGLPDRRPALTGRRAACVRRSCAAPDLDGWWVRAWVGVAVEGAVGPVPGDDPGGGVAFDAPTALVHEPMLVCAHRETVAEVGGATLVPPPRMVQAGVARRHRAPDPDTGRVLRDDRPPLRERERAHAAAKVEHLRLRVHDQAGDEGVARDPPRGVG